MEDSIDRYFDAVKELKESIMSIEGTKFVGNYKKTLLFSLMDMMAKAVYGDKSNRKRFVRFVTNFCGWKHAQYISLQQLVFIVNEDDSEELSEVREVINSRIKSWPLHQPILLDYDPPPDGIKKIWPVGYRAVGNKIPLEHLTHVHLLWTLRNSLVHELRPLGYGIEFFDEKRPHYASRGKIVKDDDTGKRKITHETWELVHPIEFYDELIENATENMRKYLIKHKINPFEKYKFGSSWLDLE